MNESVHDHLVFVGRADLVWIVLDESTAAGREDRSSRSILLCFELCDDNVRYMTDGFDKVAVLTSHLELDPALCAVLLPCTIVSAYLRWSSSSWSCPMEVPIAVTALFETKWPACK